MDVFLQIVSAFLHFLTKGKCPTTPLAFSNAHIPDCFISYNFFRQGYAPGIIGVSHGALQFIA